MAHKWKWDPVDGVDRSWCSKCGMEKRNVRRPPRPGASSSGGGVWVTEYRDKGAADFTERAFGLTPKCIDAPKTERRYSPAEIGLATEAADRAAGVTQGPKEAWLVAFYNALQGDRA